MTYEPLKITLGKISLIKFCRILQPKLSLCEAKVVVDGMVRIWNETKRGYYGEVELLSALALLGTGNIELIEAQAEKSIEMKAFWYAVMNHLHKGLLVAITEILEKFLAQVDELELGNKDENDNEDMLWDWNDDEDEDEDEDFEPVF
jgi:hypothetical protein